MNVEVVTQKLLYPVLLSSADAIWNPARGPQWNAEMQLSDRLETKYGDGFHLFAGPWEYLPGDPRRLFGRNETTSVAFWKGAVGILSEVELNIAAAASPEEEYLSCGTTYLPRVAFRRMVAHWSAKLASVGCLYPKSEIFLAHGPSTTYLGRLCLCSFTPLSGCIDPSSEGPNALQFYNPYQRPDTIAELDQALFDLVWPTTIEESQAVAA